MTERVLAALKGLGIGTPPTAVLERGEAFFALLGEMLVYQDQNGTRRVTLRDLTRIHSDQEGLLRVETPAGTALTASLVGFDPAQVQGFFAQVRDATAKAKNLPSAPLPVPGGHKTFGSMPRTGTPPGGPSRSPGAAASDPPSPGTTTVVLGADPAPTQETPVKKAPEERPAAASAQNTSARTPAISPRPGTVREVRGTPGVPSPQPGSPTPARTPASTAPEPETQPPLTAPSTASGPAVSVPAEPAPATRVAAAGTESLLAGLAVRAGAVSGLVSRLQLLGVVLGLAAVGLAVFQFLGGAPLNGLWTLIAGGVGCIALLAFADVTRLIVALARAVADGGQTHDHQD
ncbi:hypothetical protein DEIPH_ctg025orf0278 [Deinococcus phoenicis]|uniref:Uncharacterized protein n=1 Tax=Deinococcus phoenicis TaxID=1476583 RepID=A0A016QQM3_9DEIO|nr:hypothetical protein [Deinococcus phoenicis]EYB68388.1 hypothetical protein DEIPH_ctg025orf0278 [Deinococcus phoenicis]